MCQFKTIRYFLNHACEAEDVKYDLLSLSSSDKTPLFRVNFVIDVAFEHLRMRRLLEGGVHFTVPFPNAAFIGGRRL